MAKVTFDYSKAAPFINEDELNLMEAQVAAAKKLLAAWTRRSCTTRKTPGTQGWTASSAPRWRLGKFTPPAALAS